MLLIANGPADDGATRSATAGGRRCSDWVNGGGHLISWRGGTRARGAARPDHRACSASLRPPMCRAACSACAGRRHAPAPRRRRVGVGLLRVRRTDAGIVARPRGGRSSRPPTAATGSSRASPRERRSSAARPPWSTSRSARAGRPSSRSSPNFRAFTTGFQKILRNALLGVRLGARARRAGRLGSAATLEASARRAADQDPTARLRCDPARGAAFERRGRRARCSTPSARATSVRAAHARVAAFVIATRASSLPTTIRTPGSFRARSQRAGVETIAFRAP